jgi:hypothetical protein
MLSADRLFLTARRKGFSPDSVQAIAYLLAGVVGLRSDAIASQIGARVSRDGITMEEAELLMSRSDQLAMQINEEVDASMSAVVK